MISREFLGIYTGWFRAQFVAISYDENDNLKEVFFTTQIIDDEKRREAALLEVSYTDELTRLYNRRAYEEDLIAHEKEGIADNMMYVAMNLNGLKIGNDTLGHAAGDEFVAILFDTSDKDLIYDLQKSGQENL